jgi:hypothetical protein
MLLAGNIFDLIKFLPAHFIFTDFDWLRKL